MREYKYPCAFSGWDAQEHEAMQRVIASGRFTMGDECAALEAEFASYFSRGHAVAVNSGSSANLVLVSALVNLGLLNRGDLAAVPAVAWATTYSPLVQHDLALELIDIDKTWNADPEHFSMHIADKKPRLVVGCSVLGNPTNALFWERCSENGIYIEDCCESIGSKYQDGRLCGTIGLASTYSFFYSHQISAIEGGMILTDSDDVAKTCRILRNHGWVRGVEEPISLSDEYKFVLHGYNVRPLELHAAIAREQLKKLPTRIANRKANYMLWRDIAPKGILLPQSDDGISPFSLHFELCDSSIRSKVAEHLRSNGIDVRTAVGGSFGKQPYGLSWANQSTPRADRLHESGLMIGCPPYKDESYVRFAVSVIDEAINGR